MGRGLGCALAGLTVIIAACQAVPAARTGPSAMPSGAATLGEAPMGPTQAAQVVDVVDGDTIKVSLGGRVYTLRYIGMNTPETVTPGRPVEWMGPEASAANAALVAGRSVVLEKDVSEVDKYGRLLRYVWLEEPGGWLMVNLELVRTGYASVDTVPPDVRYRDLFVAAERAASRAGVGLWSETPPESGLPAGSGACDPSYPTVCIPPPPPDLDCADIGYRRFPVLPPDPHQLDGDHNGIGCESV